MPFEKLAMVSTEASRRYCSGRSFMPIMARALARASSVIFASSASAGISAFSLASNTSVESLMSPSLVPCLRTKPRRLLAEHALNIGDQRGQLRCGCDARRAERADLRFV